MQRTFGERQLDPVLAESVKNMVEKKMKEEYEYLRDRFSKKGMNEKEILECIEELRVGLQKRLEETALEESNRVVRARLGL